MPDWTYRTVFRPLLFRLPAEIARDWALGFMGRLGRMPLGRSVIELMGHMRPDPRLRVEDPRGGAGLPTPVGLGCGLDLRSNAAAAFSQFGFGLLELGPVSKQGRHAELRRLDSPEGLVYAQQPSVRLTVIERWLSRLPPKLHQRLLVRLADDAEADAAEIRDALAPHVDGLVAPAHWSPAALRELAGAGLWLATPADARDEQIRQWAAELDDAAGWIIGPPQAPDSPSWTLGREGYQQALETVAALREQLGPEPLICQAVGVHQVEHALESREAGAQIVQVSSGLAFSGPGLPKRINDALLHQQLFAQPKPSEQAKPTPVRRQPDEPTHDKAPRYAWFWAMLMGAAMFGGGLLAIAVATTRVVLPYDETMSGLTREQLQEINPRLLDFMTHDRVTLSGTMLCVGILYCVYAWWGVRRGLHWVARTIVVSTMAGFVSFFSFLGFGYFDPFHAFVAAILFQFLLLMIHSELLPRHEPEAPELTDSPRWRLAQWSQLLFVIHGAVLITAGLVISKVGMTDVFVPEDLEFMGTTAECLRGSHPSLVPLVAHDRATFGGMLLSCGVAVLLPALWGFRRGQAWLWWSLLLAGSVAYLSTIAVHWAVGYLSLKHLLPAYLGLLLLWLASLLSWPHLAASDPQLEQRWRRWLTPRR